jgi:7,8-dihydro-6-hydroxymethylpterin-pyrophosphokinase
VIMETPDLSVPHPRLAERAFVLAPLAEIAPGLLVPGRGHTVAELLTALGDVSTQAWSKGALATLDLDPETNS